MKDVAYTSFAKISDIELVDDPIQDFNLIEDGIRLECRLNTQVKNDYLIVTPNGAVNREKLVLPQYARWNYHSIFRSSILSVLDPALYLDDNLRMGWFAGTKEFDITQYTASVIEHIAGLLNISKERIIIWGSSAGGYASMLLASKIDGANFVSFHGQTTIKRYYAGHVEDYRKVFDANLSIEQIEEKYPCHWSAILALQEAFDKKISTKGVVIQNLKDDKHYQEHYIPFCEYFNLPIDGGYNSKYGLWSYLYEDDRGHGPESANMAKKIVKIYFPKLLNS